MNGRFQKDGISSEIFTIPSFSEPAILADKPLVGLLFVFLAENREVDVSFRM